MTNLVDSNPMKNQRVVLGYFTAWSIHQRKYYVSNITADRLTHVNYAFATIDSDGELNPADRYADTAAPFPGDTDSQPLRGNFNQLLKLKERHPRLRTLISVGGYVRFITSVVCRWNRPFLLVGWIRCLSLCDRHSAESISLRGIVLGLSSQVRFRWHRHRLVSKQLKK